MSFIRREIKAAWDRFGTWVLPPGMRRYNQARPYARVYRYPAPGNEPANHEFNYVDYKTAYRDSIHHIRNNVDTHKGLTSYAYMQDPIGESVEEKLVRYGFLAQDQIKNADAIQQARGQYEKEVGESPDVRVHHDDFGYSEKLISKDNTESVSEYLTSFFEGVKQGNASEAWLNDLDDIYNAQFYFLKALDVAGDDPVYRQLVVDFEGQLDDIITNRLEIKNFPVWKSNPAYWAILDDSFSGENIKKVQASVKNFTGYADLTPVVYGEGEIPQAEIIPEIAVPHLSRVVE